MAAVDNADVQRTGADVLDNWQFQREDFLQRVDELMDGAVTKFRIGGVAHLAGGAEGRAESAFGREREAVSGGFAIDEIAAALGIFVGKPCSGRVALLADDEEQTDLRTLVPEAHRSSDLRRDDAFGVATASTIDELVIFAAGDERWDGIHVGRKNQVGLSTLGRGIKIESLPALTAVAWLRNGHALDREAEAL